MSFLSPFLVVDLSRVLAGPLCGMRLADWGARVIKVESPEGDATRRFGPPFVDDESTYFMSYNRGKESIALDLREEVGREILARLIARADVLIENFREGVLDRMGFDEARLTELCPDLIRMTISGYGLDSERRSEGAFDLAIQAESGLMGMTGEEGGEPCRVPFSAADVAAGATAAEAVMAALLGRERSGQGARLEVSLIDALVSYLGFQAQSTLSLDLDPKALGHRHPSLVPYQIFPTSDGALVLAVATDRDWQRFLALDSVPDAFDREEWRTNANRVRDRESLVAQLTELMRGDSTETWKAIFDAADIPVGRLRGLREALKELRHRPDGPLRAFRHASLGEVEMIGPATRVDGRRPGGKRGAPVHNEDAHPLIAEFAQDEDERRRWASALQL